VTVQRAATAPLPGFTAPLVGGLAVFELVLLLANTGAFGHGFFIDELSPACASPSPGSGRR